MFDHKALLDALGPRGWQLAHFARKILWRIIRPARLGALAVICNEAGQVLLVENSYMPGQWQLPGGGVEKGEVAGQAVLREITEETGLTAKDAKLLGIVLRAQFGAQVQVLIYKCENVTGQARADGREILQCRWFDPAALPDSAKPFTRQMVLCAVHDEAIPPRWPDNDPAAMTGD